MPPSVERTKYGNDERRKKGGNGQSLNFVGRTDAEYPSTFRVPLQKHFNH
jgi:hypothetical protein